MDNRKSMWEVPRKGGILSPRRIQLLLLRRQTDSARVDDLRLLTTGKVMSNKSDDLYNRLFPKYVGPYCNVRLHFAVFRPTIEGLKVK